MAFPPPPHVEATGQPTLTDSNVRPRPALFRALGRHEPPSKIEAGGRPYRLVRVFKHDSWAATALYHGRDGQVVCKHNRIQPIGLLPMGWLGRHLARNERAALERLADLPNVPRCSGDVVAEGRTLRNAVAHEFIPGQPLGKSSEVGDNFYPELRGVLEEMHRRGLAYVDLHKRENVLVGDDGRTYLIDFQIAFVPGKSWVGKTWPVRAILRMLQRSDDYHYLKMFARGRPDQSPVTIEELSASRPWWIRGHRLIAMPFRSLRRGLLSRLRIRDRKGRSSSETFAEEAVRLEMTDETAARSSRPAA